ncbi:MAG: protease pro-enzyme activation domain-containing protein, partial [Bryobacteraceae bacterium]
MSLHFSMTPEQSAALDQLLRAQQDRRSPQYHRFLSPEQYAARFGLAEADIARVTRWLENHGFSNLHIARSRNWVSFSGTAGQVESVFHTAIHQYSVHGDLRIANTGDPQLPKALQGVVESVEGLNNFRMRPHAVRLHPLYTEGTGHYVTPDDWQTIYDVKPLYGRGLDGSGVSIAVVGQSDVQLSDIRAFRSAAGLPPNDPTVIVPPGDQDPGIQTASGDETEADLDVEWAGAIAPNANVVFVTASATSGNGVTDAIVYAIDNDVAPILSISYGSCEADDSATTVQTLNDLFQQANAEGMTILAASGDTGAAECDSGVQENGASHGLTVDFPASSPYVTGIGGTELAAYSSGYWSSTNNGSNGSAISYIPETAWNDGFQSATGGGASKLMPKPDWQAGAGVPADSARDVPDLAFTTSVSVSGLLFCGHNWCSNGFLNSSSYLDVIGGTSAGPPPFAGVLALVLQSDGAITGLGNINPNLYSLARVSDNAFHDIIYGSNEQSCQLSTPDCVQGLLGYTAGAGYDQVTGLGSVDASNFAEQWFGDIQLTATPTTLTIQPGSSATATVAVAPQNGFTGTVSFACSAANSLVDLTCSVSPDTVDTAGSVTVTIAASNTAQAPYGKWFAMGRPSGGWMVVALAALALLLLSLLFLNSGGRKAFRRDYVYLCSLASITVIAAVSLSCGGASSGSTISGGDGPAAIPVTLSCSLPPNTTQGAGFYGKCTVSGGTGAITFSISAGALPAGLILDPATGVISGTATAIGTNSFTVMATDSGSPPQSAIQTVTNFQVLPLHLSISCAIVDPMIIGDVHNGGCTTIGGTPPMAFSVSAGALPPGITLNPATGALTGSATHAGRYIFTIQATDSGSPVQTATQPMYVDVYFPSPLWISCSFVSSDYPGENSAQLGVPFSGYCQGVGGYPPYTYAISAGTLPPGISFNPATGQFSGTPTTLGTSSFTVQVEDSGSQTATESFNFRVGPRPSEAGLVTITAT